MHVKSASSGNVPRICYSSLQSTARLPDAINALISACEDSKLWDQAVYLLLESQQLSLQPNVIIYKAAISTCVQSSNGIGLCGGC